MVPDTPEQPVETETVTVTEPVRERAPVWRRVAKWAAIAVVAVAVLLGATLFAINTGPGRAFVARQISNYTTESGLNIRVARIEGSLYGALVLRDVEVRDTKGAFAKAQTISLDWRPFRYLSNHVDIRSVASPLVTFDRMPALKPVPSDPNAPWLPDLDIDIAKLDIARIEIGPAVTGKRHIAKLSGKAHIAGGRAQVDANGGTLSAAGIAGGDLLSVKLDAVPDQNKLDFDVRLNAPANGLVAGLSGVDQPLTFSLTGDGSWKSWKGQAVSTLGGAELADLALTAKDGTFSARGLTNPGLYLKGPVERLASPQLDVSLDVAWADRKAATKLHLRSSALDVTADGLLDFAASRFGNFRTEAMLLTPGAIAPNLNGSDVRFAMLLNGQFAAPVVDYKLQASSLGFGETRVEKLFAEGKARVDADRILVPIRAKAARVSGLNAAAGGLVTNLTVEGDLAISGDQLLSDNLKLKSDRIDATAVIAADLGNGHYAGALKGRVNDYEIDGVGVVNLTTDAELYAPQGGGWGIRGHVAGTSVKLYSDGVRNFLGGNASASAKVGFDQNGIVTFTELRLLAPQFRITGGSGRYDPSGSLLLNADGVSTQYGPMTARITGSLSAPVVAIRAPRPGVGVGLVNLEALVKGSPSGAYAIDAKGDTDYGPFTASVLVQTGRSLSVDIRTARFAGMDINGKLQQVPAGPFAGRLEFAGSGVTGSAQLSAQGDIQRADFDARANNAQIPGVAEITIGRAVVKGMVLLTETPQVVADAQVAAMRSGGFTIKTARVKIDYKGGSGTAQAYLDGSSGVPFKVAANALLRPDQWLVAVDGKGGGVGFRTPKGSPARITFEGKTYRLMPTRIAFDRGSARIAGTYGSGLTFQTRVDALDLALVNAFVPGLGVGGSATGSLDFSQPTPSSFPQANGRIEIANFTRSSLSQVSVPVNVVFVGKLTPDGGDARALIKRGDTTIGRMVTTLSPLGPNAGSWQERLLAAPLSGGIRYNGPAAVIFSLAGLSGQHVEGPIGIAADFTGRVRSPDFSGVVRASNLVYENETFGTRLSKMSIDGTFNDDRLVLNSLSAVAGSGTVKAKGTIGLSSDAGFPINITADLDNARLARSDALSATATGQLTITSDANGGKISGRLEIPDARYEVIRQGAADVSELSGVRRKSDVFKTSEQRAQAAAFGRFDLDLRITAENEMFINGMGLESEWRANLFVRGTNTDPQITGTANLVRGTYEFAGKRFTVNRGTIRFGGGNSYNPAIDISATTNAEGVTAILNITGTAQAPRISFTSTPALPQEEVLSRILFGSTVTNLSATEAIQLAASLNALRGSGGLNPLGQLRSAVGIDRLRILAADDTSGRGTALAAGQYITDDIYIEVITDARGFTATQLEIALSRALSILSQTGSFGGSSVSIRYSRDY
ncbi:translocation/assembly module TamB domain-containing protein [Sphingomonas sp. AOB5]|uniref:translocation/assembly module TamB domain-containing protein n=1 Tax=Sphingomonas sp. AOB5 TaxID=3034017 RepID=UPI0023FA4527|nr:translocation/assembly module TamB domain-containing protein [Sphingomonas sp. AOB5]MDF7774528.1 translocation/assembly module TamB domain-containing protein [Sphingomonas sp. AOB5]